MRDLNALRTFHDVAKAQGYSAAHRNTGQSRATLSRHISVLQDELGAMLIERNGKSFRLTESGQFLFDRCSELLAQLDETVTMVEDRHREPRGLVRMTIPPPILELHIGDAILRYLEANPHVRIQIEVTTRVVDVRHENIDLAIRGRSRFDDSLDLVRVPLMRSDRIVVAHPRWELAAKPTLEETLESIPVLAWSGNAGEASWHVIDRAGKERAVAVKPRMIVDNLKLLHSAVLAGMGMTIVPRVHVEEDLAARRLLHLRFDAEPPPGMAHAVHLGHRSMRPAVRHLLDWLKEASQDYR